MIYAASLPFTYALAFIAVNWSTFLGSRRKLWYGLITFPLALCLTILAILLTSQLAYDLDIDILFFPAIMALWAWAGTALSVWWIRRLTSMPRTGESRWVVFVVCLLVGTWGALFLDEFREEVFGIYINRGDEAIWAFFNLGLLFGLSQLTYAWLIYKGQQMAFEKANQRTDEPPS